ncbi:MAG: RagB/SusD family nutrient uptake outer membrane protein [Bacteroidetes bacterium]|nr:RagB/SusD family nutrient uptake outer membrane protein [Bacteroidota bacterium]MBS1756073.1 RagB/SusD family nutrient uptake outer membrane protein [Bacteroidota bacterium]
MKSINKIFVFAGILIVLVLPACKKSFLDLNPPAAIVESNFFKTQLQADQALAGVYHVCQWGNINYGHTPMVGWAEAASDDAYAGGGSPSDAVGVKGIDNFDNTPNIAFNANDATYTSVWSIYFQGVARANVFLANIDNVNASVDYKNKTTAEAKFLRALFYFHLVRWFENVPLLTKPLTNPNDYNQPQAAPQETFNQIAKDLTEAMQYLPKTSMKANSGHATYWSASAMLARVYLFCKGYYGTDLTVGTTVIDAAKIRTNLDEIITQGGFSLIPNYSDIWKKSGEMGSESVWEVDHSSLAYLSGSTSNQFQAQGNYNVLYFGPRGIATTGFSNAIPTESLYEEFEPGDPRREATIKIINSPVQAGSPTFIRGWQHTGYFNNKYSQYDLEYLTSSGLNSINWAQNNRELRYSDVLLMASELNIGVNQAKADQYLHLVRNRVGLADRPATIDNIRHERRVELAGEGVRYFDLLRYGLAYAKQEIDASSLVGPYYNGGGTFNAGQNTPAINYVMNWNTARKGHLPIPPSQVTLSNGVLKQNPGYF